jgi:hypothetical protein
MLGFGRVVGLDADFGYVSVVIAALLCPQRRRLVIGDR